MKDVEIDRAPDGTPERMRFGAGDDLAGPARVAAEALRPRYVLAPGNGGKLQLWHCHPNEDDHDFGGLAGLCVRVRAVDALEWTWVRAEGARYFWARSDAEDALLAHIEAIRRAAEAVA